MIFATLGSVLKLADDAASLALTPVKIAVDATRIVTAPIAELGRELATEVHEAAESLKPEGR